MWRVAFLSNIKRKGRHWRAGDVLFYELIASDRSNVLGHQEDRTAALDFAGDFAMEMRGHSGEAAGKNFTALGDKFFQNVGVFIVDGVDGDVHPAAGHDAVRTAEVRAALSGFWLH